MPQVEANEINIEVEAFGDPADPTVLLIMGLGAQMIVWPEDFCRLLADAGHHVVRFDNRDVGSPLSQIERHASADDTAAVDDDAGHNILSNSPGC